MIGLSYHVSPTLKDSLQKIEHFRRQIILSPLAPRVELRLRWETMINRLYWSLNLSKNPLSKSEMASLLTVSSKKKLTKENQEVFDYKKALDYITQEWLMSANVVNAKTVLFLHEIASCPGKTRISEVSLNRFLNYLQANPENPIIQAAIAQIQITQLAPFTDGNGRVARLLGLLFLYKYGYDCRGMLSLEEYFRKDLTGFITTAENAIKTENLTPWLEYFAKAAETQLEKATQLVNTPRSDLNISASFWEMSDRQKEILSLLEEPNSTIANKKVQKRFRVSQITASRDLSKLATLGLIFPHGKGRSSYYTKV